MLSDRYATAAQILNRVEDRLALEDPNFPSSRCEHTFVTRTNGTRRGGQPQEGAPALSSVAYRPQVDRENATREWTPDRDSRPGQVG